MISATTQMQNNTGGNGRGYVPMRRRTSESQVVVSESAMDRLDALNDPRMRFKNSRDPVYVAFDYVQKQPIKVLAREFVKDLVKGGLALISKK